MIFYFLYYFSFLSFHFTHTFFFFFLLQYLLHTHCISIPTPFFSFFSLIQVSSIPTLFSKKILQHFLFFSPIRSLWFFFFFLPHVVLISLSPFLYLLCLPHAQLSFSSARSLSVSFFFFFLLNSRGHYGQSLLHQFSTQAFPPNLGRRNLWARERKFFPRFSTLPIFLSFPNSGKPLSFPLYVFHPPKITPTKHSVKSLFMKSLKVILNIVQYP